MAYAASVTFPHEQVQLVIGRISFYTGMRVLYRISAGVTIALGLALTLVLIKRLAGRPERRLVIAYWLLTLTLIAGT